MDSKLNGNIISLLSCYKFKLCGVRDDHESEDIALIKDVKVVGLFFGNTMSAQTRAYNKALKDLYKLVNSGMKVLEIIFITNEDEDNIRDILNRMPWYIIEQDDTDVKDIRDIFNAYEVPKLGIISHSGDILFEHVHIDKINIDNFKRWTEKAENQFDSANINDEIKHK